MWSGNVWRGPLKKCKQNILRVRTTSCRSIPPTRCTRVYLCGSLALAPTNGVYNVLLLLSLSAAAPRGCRTHIVKTFDSSTVSVALYNGRKRGRGRRNRIKLMVAFPFTLCKLNSALFWHAWHIPACKQIQLPVALTNTFALCLRCRMLIWLI